ncbi:uncharacterized protein LOC132262505 [Phlebotomus argentipes]|uniref:uncharacterized protein LOC132262505 n=1 Tax=Phlebotomus argentipes TaxID=94469 RepID=UPI002892FEE6|nr:uncharacterized protein LOC132262505 [Phlebotomus argentipes]
MPWVPMYNGAEIPVNRPDKVQEQQQAPYNYHPAPLQNAYLPPAKQQAPVAPVWSQQVNLQADPRFTPPPAVAGVTSPEYLPPRQLLPIQDQRQHQLVPIPVPNLSVTPIPPLYDYKPFSSGKVTDGTGAAKITNIIIGTNVEKPNNPGGNRLYLPPAQNTGGYHYPRPAARFPTGADPTTSFDPQSQVETFAPTMSPGQRLVSKEHYNDLQTDFEIIKSIPLVQFTSSVSFPNPMVQPVQSVQPAILTTIPPEVVEVSSPIVELVAPSNQKYISQPIIVDHEESTDSYTAASSHNITVQQDNFDNYDNFLDTRETVVVAPPETFNFTEDDVRAVIQAASESGKRIPLKKDRDTPKNLLDSPIFHAIKSGNPPKPFTRDPSDLRVSQRPDHTPWLPTTTPWTTFSPYREPLRPTSSSVEASGAKSGLEPPPPPLPVDSINLITKRPKQIQIIIPYTSNNHPQPFKTADDFIREGEIKIPSLRDFSKWSNAHNGQEFHAEEETQYITATQTPSHKTTRFLSRIVKPTINIRELLRNEKDVAKISPLPFDLVTLQKNIDDWTEQEFAAEPHKASTISLLAPSKKIPDEYLTTPSMDELYYQTTTLETTLDYDATSYELPQSDESSADEVIRQATEAIEDNEVQHDEDYKTEINPPLWGHLKVAISPLTQEKIYVVTPQPARQEPAGFKSPRFNLGSRPTPGASSAGINSLQSQPTPYVPELFGKLADSPFVNVSSEEQDEVSSRKITIITPSPSRKKFTENILDRRDAR